MKCRKSTVVMLAVIGAMLLVNLLARFCRPAADFYITYIFPYIAALWSNISGLVPFSIGEWMIVIGIALALLLVPGYLLLLFLVKKDHRPKAASIYGQIYGWILTWLSVVFTMHFTVLYQGTPLSETVGEATYTNEEVLDVVQQLAVGANREAALVARDEDGYFIMTDELMPEAKQCMRNLAEAYPQFKGSYPDAKPIYHSYFFSQQGLLGIYYPHSMEANYNPVVYPVNLPVTICHEYTHLKGNIFEDEAGYYAFLACMTSESADFRYSAYISALKWLEVDFGEDAAAWERYHEICASLDEGVRQDLYAFVPDDYWEAHQQKELIPTELVTDTADVVIDTSLKVNGVSEGKESYHGMTALLLHYYLAENH